MKRSIKDAAKKGQKDVCVILAKELIRSRKAVSKLYASKAHMNSVLMGMKNQLGKNFKAPVQWLPPAPETRAKFPFSEGHL